MFHAADGSVADFNTKIELEASTDFLKIKFNCLENPFVAQNHMHGHNEELYNQEVFEIFISAGHEDPVSYLEVEINPNNALWIGQISNPTLGSEMQTLSHFYDHEQSGIIHGVETKADSWSGFINIPWNLISETKTEYYRLNFYRIRSHTDNKNSDWICNDNSCDFVCWKPTLSGEFAAFHRPKRFGLMRVL